MMGHFQAGDLTDWIITIQLLRCIIFVGQFFSGAFLTAAIASLAYMCSKYSS